MSSIESNEVLSSLRSSISVSVGKGEPVDTKVYLEIIKLKNEGVKVGSIEDFLKCFGLYEEYVFHAPKNSFPQSTTKIFLENQNSKFSQVDDSGGKGYRRVNSAIGRIFAEINRKLTQDLVVIAGK